MQVEGHDKLLNSKQLHLFDDSFPIIYIVLAKMYCKGGHNVSMRIKEIYSMLMTVKEQTDDELSSALNLLSDKMIGE